MASEGVFRATVTLESTVADTLKSSLRSTASALSNLGSSIKVPAMAAYVVASHRMGKASDAMTASIGQTVLEMDRLAAAHQRLGTTQKISETFSKKGKQLQEVGKTAGDLASAMEETHKLLFGTEQGAGSGATFMDMLTVVQERGGFTSAEVFREQANMAQQLMSTLGDGMDASEWNALMKAGGLATKNMSDEAFYYQLAPLVREMGGEALGAALNAAYRNLYQGQASAGAMGSLEKLGLMEGKAALNPGVLKGAELFRSSQYEWMKKVLLPTLAQQGLVSKDQVENAIGSIFDDRQATHLFTTMYAQMAGMDQSENAIRSVPNIGQLLGSAAISDAPGQRTALQSSAQSLPLGYVQSLQIASGALAVFNALAAEHPVLIGTIVTSLGWMTAGLQVIAPVLQIMGTSLQWVAPLLGTLYTTVSMLWPVLQLLGQAVSVAGSAVMWLGRLMLMNPIGLAITAIALGAYLVIQHWTEIKTFMLTLWEDIKQIIGGAWDLIVGIFSLNGERIKKGWNAICDGFKSYFTNILEGIKSVFESTVGWIKEKIEWVSSPFKKSSTLNMDTPGFKFYTGALGEDVPRPSSPSLPAIATAGGYGTQNYSFNIAQLPGESAEQLAQRIASLLKQQQPSFQVSSSLHDPPRGMW